MANPSTIPALTVERATFEHSYPQFMTEHLGKVVLIHGTNILGFFDSLPSAEDAAYRRFNLYGESFLMRPIVKPDQENREDVYQRLNLAELA